MSLNLELKKMKSKEQQRSSKIARERYDLPQLRSSVGPSCQDPYHRMRLDNDNRTFVQPKGNRSLQSAKGSATNSDELVKHMTNLPCYLQRSDRGEKIQENPLNFGVLDWSRLEKWKHKQKPSPAQASNVTLFNGNESSSRIANNTSSASRSKTVYKEGLLEGAIPYYKNVRRSQHFETEGKRKGSGKIVSEVGNLASHLKHDGVSSVTTENKCGRDGKPGKNVEDLQECNLKKKERNHKLASDMQLPSSKFESERVFLGSEKKFSSRGNKGVLTGNQLQASETDANLKQGYSKPNDIVLLRPREVSFRSNKTKTKDGQFQESDIDANYKQCHSKPKNIVLLHPREIPRSNSPEIFNLSQIRTSYNDTLAESSRRSLSNSSFLEDINSKVLCSEIPHSSKRDFVVEPAATLEGRQHTNDTDPETDYSSIASETPPSSFKRSSLASGSAYFENDVLDSKLGDQCDFSNLKGTLDQETSELTAKSGRTLSSSRRFSFSLSRIGRSFSFKEGSTLPQFSSTYVSAKSGPVSRVSSARWDDSGKVKENGHNQTKSSPLRRLLDPIWKYKASRGRLSTESSHERKGSLGSISFRSNRKGSLDSISFRTDSFRESLPDEISEGSSVQALIQFTIKNGLPIFKFVLNNETKILAAATKSSSPEKDDLGCYFTFYLLNEIKKKSGRWYSHGNKEKSCGYVYNIVAQMKFSSSSITEPSNQNYKRHSLRKEYVLLGAEVDQTVEGPPKVIQSQELAAVVVEISSENLIHKGLYWDNNLKGCLACLGEDRCRCNSGENDITSNTTVILPGGIHSSPIKGEPSPLIDRWKSGGLCDCGGWDIGCKLLVLSNQKQSSKSYVERFQLFVQV